MVRQNAISTLHKALGPCMLRFGFVGDALTPEEAARVFEEFGPADPNGCLDIKTVMAKLTQPVPTRHPTMEVCACLRPSWCGMIVRYHGIV